MTREISTFIGHVDHLRGFSIAEHYAMLNGSRSTVFTIPDPVLMLRTLTRAPPRRGLVFFLLHHLPTAVSPAELSWLLEQLDAVVREAEGVPVFVSIQAHGLGEMCKAAHLFHVDLSAFQTDARAQAEELIRVLPGVLLAGT